MNNSAVSWNNAQVQKSDCTHRLDFVIYLILSYMFHVPLKSNFAYEYVFHHACLAYILALKSVHNCRKTFLDI